MTVASDVQPRIPPRLGLLIGILAVSTASTFIRLAQVSVPSLALAAWRLTFASVILAPFALTGHRYEWQSLQRKDAILLAVTGIVLAVHFYTWITSLAVTSVAASSVLVATNPLFVGLISYFFLGERLSRQTFVGMVIAVIGSAVIGAGDAGSDSHNVAGDVLALAGAAAVAVYMLLGRRFRAQLSLIGYVFPVYGTAAIVLMMVALITGAPLIGYPPIAWLWLVLIALIPQVIGHSSFNWALGHLSATYVALAALAEPIGSTLLAWWILDEAPKLVTILGGVLILLGLGIAIRPKRSPHRHPQRTRAS